MVFATLPITAWGPSDSFLSAYRAAVSADADSDISSNRYPTLDKNATKDSGKPNDIVALHFGDLFVQEKGGSQTAYIVLTPECDLAFGGSRSFPHNRSVVLLPGKMTNELPFKASAENAARTELVHWKGKDWKIEWRVKQAENVPLGEFQKWAKEKELERVARIEFLFAAAVLSAYVGNLTRVGLPVVPPQFQPQNARVYVEDWNKNLIPVCDTIIMGQTSFHRLNWKSGSAS